MLKYFKFLNLLVSSFKNCIYKKINHKNVHLILNVAKKSKNYLYIISTNFNKREGEKYKNF